MTMRYTNLCFIIIIINMSAVKLAFHGADTDTDTDIDTDFLARKLRARIGRKDVQDESESVSESVSV